MPYISAKARAKRASTGENTDQMRFAYMYLQSAIDHCIARAKEVRALSESEKVFGRNISEMLATQIPAILDEMQKIILSQESSKAEKIAAANIVARIETQRTAAVVSERIAVEKKERAALKRTHIKSIDKRATAVERRRIDKQLKQAVAEIKSGTVPARVDPLLLALEKKMRGEVSA